SAAVSSSRHSKPSGRKVPEPPLLPARERQSSTSAASRTPRGVVSVPAVASVSPDRPGLIDGELATAPLVEGRRVEKWFGPQPAVRGVDFTLSSGEFVVLFGPNGAGKTTLLRLLA